MDIRPRPTPEQQEKINRLLADGVSEKETLSIFRSAHTVRKGQWIIRDPLAEIIRKEGLYWVLYSHSGKKLYKARSKKAVQKREEQINFFKHKEDMEVNEMPEVQEPEKTEKEENKLNEYAPWGVYSFADLLAMREQEDRADKIAELTEDFIGLLQNIVYDPAVEEKYNAMIALWGEFSNIIKTVLEEPPLEGNNEEKEKTEDVEEKPKLAESEGGIIDAEFAEVSANPMYMDVRLIRPGWGNRRDNHYYPAEMLARDAARFIGAKMFETDHKDEEKSTRTWVSTVEKIVRFDEDGSPIARVVVHDPDFAQRVANLKAAGMLDKMECSILAYGKIKPGFELDGRKGSVVETITDVISVDWVTKAGAGGAAIDIQEDEKSEGITDESKPEPMNEEQPLTVEKPLSLTTGEVWAILDNSRLPQPAKVRLAEREWRDASELRDAVGAEIAYLKEITKSGMPVELGETRPREIDWKAIEERKNQAVRKLIGGL